MSIWTLSVFSLLVLTACAAAPAPPLWFDGFNRQPIFTVTVNGHRIAYLDVGTGPPVILVHGLGGSMWQWEYQQTPLAAIRRVITPDLLGSGLSDKPALEYTPDEMVAFFIAFMDTLGIHQASLVGCSMGAGLVMAVAIAQPKRVDRLVLIGGLPQRVREKLTGPLTRRAVETSAPLWLIQLANWFAGRSVTEQILKEIVFDHSRLTPAVIDRSYRNRRQPGVIHPLVAMARNLPYWEQGFATRIGEIRQPTLIIWGAEDRVFPTEVAHELHRLIRGATLSVIPLAGHLPQWERPEVVNPLLISFLKS
jgi:pimeloyl-ACP methyl ester carboxylesterase